MRYLTEKDQAKFKHSNELFIKLADVRKRHLEIHKKYYLDKATDEEVIAIDKELIDVLEEWRSSLILFDRLD